MEKTKNRIARETIRLFGEKGYDVVTMREIAAAVGVKASSIYNYFDSKEEILANIVDYYIAMENRYTPDLESILQSADTKPPEEVLGAFHYSYAAEDQETMLHLFRIIFREQYNNTTIRKHLMNVILLKTSDMLAQVLLRLMERGKIPRSDPRAMATIWVNTMNMEALKASHYVTDPDQFLPVYNNVGRYLIDSFCGKNTEKWGGE